MSAARIAAIFRVSKPEALLQGLLQVDLIHRPAAAECPVFAHSCHRHRDRRRAGFRPKRPRSTSARGGTSLAGSGELIRAFDECSLSRDCPRTSPLLARQPILQMAVTVRRLIDGLQARPLARLDQPIARSGAYFGWGAGAPPEVPGGGTTFGSPVLGAGFWIPGSPSFGWMIPFDWFSSLLRLWAGGVGLAPGAAPFGAGPVAWAKAAPATSVTPATIRQSREQIIRMLS
jgi:hypothetical protein